MKPMRGYLFFLLIAGLVVACDDDVRPDDDSGTDSDSDTDSDTDGDTDTDSDTDTDTDTDYLPMTDCEGGKYDPNSDLCWEDPYPTQQYSWNDAVAYCEDLIVGASEDWRMPTVTELRSLVRGCSVTEVDGSCPISDNSPQSDETEECNGCEGHMGPGNGGCYWDEALVGDCDIVFWSFSEITDVSEGVWVFGFGWAIIADWSKGQADYVRCVRDGQ